MSKHPFHFIITMIFVIFYYRLNILIQFKLTFLFSIIQYFSVRISNECQLYLILLLLGIVYYRMNRCLNVKCYVLYIYIMNTYYMYLYFIWRLLNTYYI